MSSKDLVKRTCISSIELDVDAVLREDVELGLVRTSARRRVESIPRRSSRESRDVVSVVSDDETSSAVRVARLVTGDVLECHLFYSLLFVAVSLFTS